MAESKSSTRARPLPPNGRNRGARRSYAPQIIPDKKEPEAFVSGTVQPAFVIANPLIKFSERLRFLIHGTMVVATELEGGAAEVTIAIPYLRDFIRAKGKRFTFATFLAKQAAK